MILIFLFVLLGIKNEKRKVFCVFFVGNFRPLNFFFYIWKAICRCFNFYGWLQLLQVYESVFNLCFGKRCLTKPTSLILASCVPDVFLRRFEDIFWMLGFWYRNSQIMARIGIETRQVFAKTWNMTCQVVAMTWIKTWKVMAKT